MPPSSTNVVLNDFVNEGDVVLIEDGVFHRVHAGARGCYFVCVFDGRRKF